MVKTGRQVFEPFYGSRFAISGKRNLNAGL